MTTPKYPNPNTFEGVLEDRQLPSIRLLFQVPVDVGVKSGLGRAGAAFFSLGRVILDKLSPVDRADLACWMLPCQEAGTYFLPTVETPWVGGPVVSADGDGTPTGVARAIHDHLEGLRTQLKECPMVVMQDPDAGFLRPTMKVEDRTDRIEVVIEGLGLGGKIAEKPARKALRALAPEAALLKDTEARGREIMAELGKELDLYFSKLDPEDPNTRVYPMGYVTTYSPVADLYTTAGSAAHRRRQEAILEAGRALREAEIAMSKAQKEALASIQAEIREGVKAFALGIDHLRPGAEEEYDMGPGVVEHLAKTLGDEVVALDETHPTLTAVNYYLQGGKGWDATDIPTARKNPSADAILIRRAVVGIVEAMKPTLPKGFVMIVSPVGRIVDFKRGTYPLDEGGERYYQRTGFIVQIGCEVSEVAPDAMVVVFCE